MTGESPDFPDTGWAADIDQVIFHGSFAMEEVVFYHRASRTAIICDLIQRFPLEYLRGLKGLLMKGWTVWVVNAAARHASGGRSFCARGPARAARQKLLNWKPPQLLIAHGKCERSDAAKIISHALSWF